MEEEERKMEISRRWGRRMRKRWQHQKRGETKR